MATLELEGAPRFQTEARTLDRTGAISSHCDRNGSNGTQRQRSR